MPERETIPVSVSRNELEDRVVVGRALVDAVASRVCEAFVVPPNIERHGEFTAFSMPAYLDERALLVRAGNVVQRLTAEGFRDVVLERGIHHYQVLA